MCITVIATENVNCSRYNGESVGGAGGVFLLHHDGVLELLEHKPVVVQGMRSDRRDGATGRLQVPRRGKGAARGGAHQQLESAGAAGGARRAGLVRGHVERPARPSAQAARVAADRRTTVGGRAVAVLHCGVVGIARGHGRRASSRDRVLGRSGDAVQRHQLARGRPYGRGMADGQVRRGRRHHRRGRHTGDARVRLGDRQRGLRGRVPDRHRPGPHEPGADVRVHRRLRADAAGRQTTAVPGRHAHHQPDGRVP